MLGNARAYAPIRHMSDAAVRDAVNNLHLPYEEVEDTLPLCTRCMTAVGDEVYCPEVGHHIPRVEWDQSKSLTAFRARFGLEAPNG